MKCICFARCDIFIDYKMNMQRNNYRRVKIFLWNHTSPANREMYSAKLLMLLAN